MKRGKRGSRLTHSGNGAGGGGAVAETWMGATWVQLRLVRWLWAEPALTWG